MIISKAALEKIKKIVKNNYKHLILTTSGAGTISEGQLKELQAEGFDLEKEDDLLSLVYYNNVLNDLDSSKSPSSVSQMKRQQEARPVGSFHSSAEEHINESYAHYVDKHTANMVSRIEGLLRDGNLDYRNNALQNQDRADAVSDLLKESMSGKFKQRLRDLSGDSYRDFERIAVTETANAIGIGSVDRVLKQNQGKSPEGILVYRIPVNDAALCRHCRRFYLDSDGTPAVYKLSTLMGNGTNFGKKMNDWLPVAGATHPNDRESGVLELRPGWKVNEGGSLEYIGQEDWEKYISSKLRS